MRLGYLCYLSFTTPEAYVVGLSIRYSCHPPDRPYQVAFYQYDDKLLLHLKFGLDASFGLLYPFRRTTIKAEALNSPWPGNTSRCLPLGRESYSSSLYLAVETRR